MQYMYMYIYIYDFWRLAFVSRLGGEISGGQAATIMLVHARSRA